MIFIAALTFSQIAKAGNKQAGSDFEPTSKHARKQSEPARLSCVGWNAFSILFVEGIRRVGIISFGGGGSGVSSGGGGQVMCLGV